MEFAEWSFRQTSTLADGAQIGDVLESGHQQMAGFRIAKAAVVVAPPPPFPLELDFLWEWYIDVSSGLPINGMVAPTISWDTLKAWQDLARIELEPWQAQTLVRLGSLRVSIQMEVSDKAKPKDAAAVKRGR